MSIYNPSQGGVAGPASSTSGDIPAFSGTNGQTLSDPGSANLSSTALTLTSGTSLNWNSDTYLVRSAANTLSMLNGANGQVFRIYGSTTTAVGLGWESGNFFIDGATVGSNSIYINGSGSQGIRFQYGGTGYWQINTSGNFIAVTDGVPNIGASGASRPNNIYLKGTLAQIGGINTVGAGVPAEYATVATVAHTSSISSTTLYAVPSTGAGMYRCNYSLIDTATSGSVTVSIGWNNGTATNTDTSASLTLTGSGAEIAGSFVFVSAASVNITYSTALTVVSGTPSYTINLRLEYLG
jgi:hypothetical protein